MNATFAGSGGGPDDFLRNIVIRPERESEFPAINELIKEAFADAPHSDGKEREFVRGLRAGRNYIPSLALVAESGGTEGRALLGHVMLTRIGLTLLSGRNAAPSALLLAPLCVGASHRGRGLGAALVRAAFDRARALAFQSVFLVGDPAYYARFGFRRADEFSIRPGSHFPPEYFLALELDPGALQDICGVAELPG